MRRRRVCSLAPAIVFVVLSGCGAGSPTAISLPSGDVVKCAETVSAARTTGDCNGGGVVQLTATVSPASSGTVTDNFPDSNIQQGSERYLKDSRFTLKATPAAGFQFDHWEGSDCSGSTQPTCTLTMDKSKGMTAFFRK